MWNVTCGHNTYELWVKEDICLLVLVKMAEIWNILFRSRKSIVLVRNCSRQVMNMKWINKLHEHDSSNTLDINQRLSHIREGVGYVSNTTVLYPTLLCWRRHVSATVGHLQVTKMYIEENYTQYDHSIGAYSKLSTSPLSTCAPDGHLQSVNNTRCCIIHFWPPDDEHIVLETCRGI